MQDLQTTIFGTKESPEVYEPFWFRTFRFIRFEMKTYEEPLVLRNFTYTETGYPLNVQTKADASDERFKKIWEISERTLRCCMLWIQEHRFCILMQFLLMTDLPENVWKISEGHRGMMVC